MSDRARSELALLSADWCQCNRWVDWLELVWPNVAKLKVKSCLASLEATKFSTEKVNEFLGKLLKTRRSLDGEWLALEERNVEFKNSRVLFLTQPVDYVHVIDKESPLYELSKSVLRGDEPLELIVIMAGKLYNPKLKQNFNTLHLGIVEGTGMACQVRTSYICNEILWGHRFEPAISRYPKFGGYQVDYNKIDKTYEVRENFSTFWC